MPYSTASGAQRMAASLAALKFSIATSPARESTGGDGVLNDYPADTLAQAAADALSAAGVAGALPANQAVVANNGSVPVKNSAGTVTKTGTATVSGGAVSGVALPATSAILDNAAANVVVQNSAGAAISSAGVAAVAAGAITSIRLPATIAAVSNGSKVNAGTVTGTGNFATFTVANGVITGITLSAS